MKNVPDKYQKGQTWFDAHYISVIEVEERFGVSRQQQRNLYAKEAPPDALYVGATLFYWRDSAEPFYAEYDARQKARVKSCAERKAKRKPGRPPKEDKEAWRDTHLGDWHIVIGEEYSSAQKWLSALSLTMSKRYPDVNHPDFQAWLEKRRELQVHFGIRTGL